MKSEAAQAENPVARREMVIAARIKTAFEVLLYGQPITPMLSYQLKAGAEQLLTSLKEGGYLVGDTWVSSEFKNNEIKLVMIFYVAGQAETKENHKRVEMTFS